MSKRRDDRSARADILSLSCNKQRPDMAGMGESFGLSRGANPKSRAICGHRSERQAAQVRHWQKVPTIKDLFKISDVSNSQGSKCFDWDLYQIGGGRLNNVETLIRLNAAGRPATTTLRWQIRDIGHRH